MDSYLTQVTSFNPIGSPKPPPRFNDAIPASLATLSIHADKKWGDNESGDIAPAIHVSTTYHVDNPTHFHYARNDTPTRTRAEHVLGQLEGGHAVLYSSGMATVFAVLHHYNPKRVAICKGYHVTHKALNLWYKDDFATKVVNFDVPLQAGDLVWLETPRNPTCEVVDLEAWGKRAKEAGATLVVDSTFASPVLQKAFTFPGVDMVMHSCTKFLSGHDDVLCGALITKDEKIAEQLNATRTILGSVPGSLECFLLLRSLRTLTLRVLQQSKSASQVAAFLHGHKLVKTVYHPSLPSNPYYDICKKQMKGPPGILSVEFVTAEVAQQVMKKLELFTQATSLGGSMSLVDWRYARDKTQPEALLRVSVGLEDSADLINDWKQALSV